MRAAMAAAAVVAAALGAAAPASGRGAAEMIRSGNQAYAAGNYKEAASRFERAGRGRAGAALPLYDLGVALYAQGNFPAALAAFQGIQSPPADLAADVHFNLGSALARVGKLQEKENPQAALGLYRQSVAAFKRALALQPGRADAAADVEVVRTWIRDLLDSSAAVPSPGDKGQGSGGGGGSQGGGQSRKPNTAPGSPGPPPTGSQGPAVSGTPRDETPNSILEEERDRRDSESRTRTEGNSNGAPNW
jgi:tetratricopeptide (TPR) repeat protein